MQADTSILIGSDIESQTEQSLKNIETLLGNYNCSIENVISCTVYLKDINDFSAMNNVYEKFFVKGRYPTRTTVEVSNLPRNALIEITAVGYKY